ncbi:hypothetical protein IY73_04220 [Lawsonella clevelandensis]|uniref:hypothetical protein n=1 Tax=Lawsonella clevelandensis TaxID=1528099 RepID=UPI0006B53685|nr:hypothetical protein [Lawsonella clevelandensis]ALE34653.1 hypothetical protein IY73_04220 [Lawsonella clevelandensis]
MPRAMRTHTAAMTPFTVDKARDMDRLIDSAGIMDLIDKWVAEDKPQQSAPGGRPRIISLRAGLILWLYLATTGRPQHITQATYTLCHEATDKTLDFLGLPSRDKAKAVFDSYDRQQARWYDRLWFTLHTIIATIDPYPEVTYRHRLSKQDYAALVSGRD